MAGFTHVFPELAVASLDKTVNFYTRHLGLDLDWRAGDDLAVVGNGTISLFLKAKCEGAFGPCRVILNVNNADAVFQAGRLRA